jgi:N-acetylglucosaminyldiphosphoundecaprenol N-acetyl-beta-D-mannosaminyltransferase
MRRYNLLGVEVNALTIDVLNRLITQAVADKRKTIIANHNLHSVYLFRRLEKMRSFFRRADYIHIDGMPLVFWARLMGLKLKPNNRITYVDWIRPLLSQAAQEQWRVFYLGSRPGIAEKALQIIKGEFPELDLQCHHGYFEVNGSSNQEVLNRIGAFRPHLLLVGMGMPRQEYWILDNDRDLAANAILTVGACFDYLTGAVATPPRWLGRLGLEWTHRLVHDPRRLWKRYLLEPWFLLPLAIRDVALKLQGKWN